MKVEVDALDSPSLKVRTVSVNAEQQLKSVGSEVRSRVKVEVDALGSRRVRNI